MSKAASSSIWAPFRSRDFALLYCTNLAEFFATVLSRLSAIQSLYEMTGDARALGMLGAITLVCQIPSIALGGVLADAVDRTWLVSRVQSAAALVATTRWLLCWSGLLEPGHIYLTVGLLEITSRLESSARSAVTPAVVQASELPNAISLLTITQYAGELVAPFAFWLLADTGGTLSLAFFAAATGFVAAAVFPRFIRADTSPASGSRAGARDVMARAGGIETRGGASAITRAWVAGLRSMIEGMRYILGHPLLPPGKNKSFEDCVAK